MRIFITSKDATIFRGGQSFGGQNRVWGSMIRAQSCSLAAPVNRKPPPATAEQTVLGKRPRKKSLP